MTSDSRVFWQQILNHDWLVELIMSQTKELTTISSGEGSFNETNCNLCGLKFKEENQASQQCGACGKNFCYPVCLNEHKLEGKQLHNKCGL